MDNNRMITGNDPYKQQLTNGVHRVLRRIPYLVIEMANAWGTHTVRVFERQASGYIYLICPSWGVVVGQKQSNIGNEPDVELPTKRLNITTHVSVLKFQKTFQGMQTLSNIACQEKKETC